MARSTAGLLVLGAVLACTVSQGLAKNGEVMTNSFYVKIHADKDHPDPAGLAHKIARRNGFHNLGPVSRDTRSVPHSGQGCQIFLAITDHNGKNTANNH
jgi:hypothetical protein